MVCLLFQFYKEKCDYKVHILLQGSKDKEATSQPADSSTPSTSRAGSEIADEKEESPKVESIVTVIPSKSSMPSTPVASSSGCYSCPSCNFSTTRLNVLIMHNKTHSVTYMPYTPSPVRKKTVVKAVKSPPKLSKTPKIPRPRKDKSEKHPKKPQGKKRTTDEKVETKNIKKLKTDEEIKSSLLADWDDADDDSNEESPGLLSRSPEIPVGAESPAAPIPAELPRDLTSPLEKKLETESTDKPESSSDSKYEFCEDEDWPEEADAGRKIPRVKNPSKRKEETKSLSVEDDLDVAREVAELLNKTTVPELPNVPEPLKVEENFPEPSIVKSPDKKLEVAATESGQVHNAITETKPTKTIFKTKTFFRSRHSRSQDAIGKYVAEQLNAAERMDLSETELNGSEVVSSPEARESPPVEPVKVARLAPKIQLKKMKAEAAQKEKIEAEQFTIDVSKSSNENIVDNSQVIHSNKPMLDVLYPTQEIKPISKELPNKLLQNEDNGEDQNCTVLDNVKKMNVDTNRDTIETQYKTVDSIYPSNSTTMPEKFLEASPEKAPEDQQVEAEPIVLGDNITSTPKREQFDLNIRDIKDTQNKFVVHDDLSNNIGKTENTVKQSKSSPGILSSISVSPKKSKETRTFTEDAINTTPQKSNESLKESSPSTNFQTQQNSLKSFEPLIQPYMNESTASAVDALLSVSRETDRVPRIVSNDLPEDLFEDDNKESGPADNCITENIGEEMSVNQKVTIESKEMEIDQPNDINVVIDKEVLHDNIVQNDVTDDATNLNENVVSDVISEIVKDNLPSESDLQIAETLINLPSSAIQNNATEHEDSLNVPTFIENEETVEEVVPTSDNVVSSNVFETKVDDTAELETESLLIPNNKNLNIRYETEQEKSENLNAAQSLVQMSESMDHKITMAETKVLKKKELPSPTIKTKQNNGLDKTVEQKVALLSTENSSDPSTIKSPKFETTSSKLLKILEEPPTVKVPINKTTPIKQTTPVKQVVISGKEKILNFDVAKSSMKGKPQTTKQKIIIRRTGPPKNLMNINNLSEVVASPDKIILSRSNMAAQDGSSVQTFTIQASPEVQTDPKQIIIQPKIRKITKTATKLHKIKPQESLVVQPTESKTIVNDTSVVNEPMFDINSMPVVLSDDILTPESIEKMPIVMSDGNIITTNPPNPPKLIKTKPTIIENEKITISPPSKPEVKTLLLNSDIKSSTPNILSKSSKLRAAKPMLVIDKATGKQKIIMTKTEPIVKEIKPAPTLIQQVPQSAAKTEKFIILPTTSSPRTTGRTQKIVIDPQTGKAHVLVTKGQEPALSVAENKPVSAKLIQSSSDTANPGNTVMIITNAQGAQSRIVLTPEHEKILFPNKQQPNVSQLKTITQRISTNAPVAPKSVVSTHVKAQTKIVPKQQKSAIITSKGQLIVGGRVATATQNIAPMPEIRPALKPVPKRIVASEPKKLVQAIQKTTSEPLIFLQQKSGAVMQLTAAQFEHLQRTGQIVQKVTAPIQEHKIVQKSVTISPKEHVMQPVIQKQRVRKSITASPSPAKKIKQEIAIAPAPVPIPTPVLVPTPAPVVTPAPSVPLPPLTSLSNTTLTASTSISNNVPAVSNTVSVSTTQNYTELDNFEELLPSTAIARQSEPTITVPQPEPVVTQVEQVAEPQAQLSDGQLLAVSGENFGGPPGSFYLCVKDNGTLTPIDNRPLVLENNELVPMAIEPAPVFAPQPERRDILEAALANSDVFHADTSRDEAPDFRDLNANVSVHCRVSETSTTLNQPIMTPVEVPTKAACEPTTVPSNLEDGLAVIGVTPQTVPTSLELPITVTDPRIALKTTDPLSNSNYATSLLTSPNTEMDFPATEEAEVVGPISMPLLTDEETVGKSMPILTDDVAERTVSSVESTVGSPSSIEVRESEAEEGATWAGARRLLTPGSDTSENSAEIPLQPAIQLSVNDLSRHS